MKVLIGFKLENIISFIKTQNHNIYNTSIFYVPRVAYEEFCF